MKMPEPDADVIARRCEIVERMHRERLGERGLGSDVRSG